MSRHVHLRVKASNAIVALVDFNASAMATAEGEISQKDALLAQMAERIATLEAEKKTADTHTEELNRSHERISKRLEEERTKFEAVRCLIGDLISQRDAVGAPGGSIVVTRFDSAIDPLRKIAEED